MGGVTSRAGRVVSRRALQAMGAVPDWYKQQMGGVPDWYKAMNGTTLGDDTIGAMSDEQFKRELLDGQQKLLVAHEHWADGDRMQKWIAIGATLAIPLSAAIWRALGIGRRRRP